MDTVARVLRLEGAAAVVVVEAEAAGGCGRCNEPGGCRGGLLNQMFFDPVREFHVLNQIGARAGDRVLVHLGAGGLARWSLTTYLLPVAAVLIGAALGASIVGDDSARNGGAVGGSLVGLILAAWLIVFRLAPATVGAGPRLVRIENEVPNRRRGERP